ncbi:MAG: alpha/beta hydrolase [Planctomycetaceae bacterium]
MRLCLSLAITAGMMLSSTSLIADENVTIRADVVYDHKDGMALTMDLLVPPQPNGATILFLRSGAWYSAWTDPQEAIPDWRLFLDHGFTVGIVRHGSAPKYTVPEALDDVRRCIRFIHKEETALGIDASRLGVCGESAGGHLTLMLTTTGDDGDPSATDPLLRFSSRVATGAAICPPTDLRGWTTHPPRGIAEIEGLKEPLTFDAALEDDVSPLLHVTSDDAPVLMLHGDKDTVVPIEHSRNMLAACERAGVPARLFVAEGGGHGFSPGRKEKTIRPEMLRWFKEHLSNRPSPQEPRGVR